VVVCRVNYKIYNGRRETEGDKRRKREVINKLLSQDVPLDILLIRGSCSRSGAWQSNRIINELSSGCYQRREGKWDNFVIRSGRETGLSGGEKLKENEMFKEHNFHITTSPLVTKNCEICILLQYYCSTSTLGVRLRISEI